MSCSERFGRGWTTFVRSGANSVPRRVQKLPTTSDSLKTIF